MHAWAPFSSLDPLPHMTYDVIVIGGGLAGCSASMQLARRGLEVLLLEKSSYPSHKLCGEFLSPESQRSFERLGVLEGVRAAGAHEMTQARFTAPNGTETDAPLPGTALGLSRYRLDALLFDHARRAGVDGRTGTAVTDVEGSLSDGFTVSAGGESFAGRLVLGAYGKRGILDRTLDRDCLHNSSLVAFKAHYAGADVPHTIELHAFEGGYCGCSHVEDGRLNVCWIGTVDALTDAGGSPEAMIKSAMRQNPALADRLAGTERITDRFEAVSQVSLDPKGCFAQDICMIGDTAQMIAPLCGDGMAMALSAADLVVDPATSFLRGDTVPAAFRRKYRHAWSDAFSTRLRLGRWAHTAAFHPRATSLLITAFRLAPPLARWLIRSTRGG